MARLIDDDVLKAAINRETQGRNMMIAAGDVLDIIDGQPDAEPVRQWISVEDRLPETVTDVLLKFTSKMAVGYIGCDGWWVASGGNWYTRVIEGVDEMPQFWMPLSEPPKEDDDGEQ